MYFLIAWRKNNIMIKLYIFLILITYFQEKIIILEQIFN